MTHCLLNELRVVGVANKKIENDARISVFLKITVCLSNTLHN